MVGRLMDAVEPSWWTRWSGPLGVSWKSRMSKVRVRWVGHALEASFAITVDCDMTVGGGHRVAEEVRHRLLHDVAKVDTAVIHVNPCGHDGADPHEALRHHDVPAVSAR
jgi:divalent metal cation (Fe/Co/Zn/Cd) transporter